MAKDIKNMLAQKLAENSKRHAEAHQETMFEPGRQHVKLPVDQIDPNPYQPRRVFPQDAMDALATSISESGLLQPISVRSMGERYQIIAGERRWRAHQLLGRHSIEALVMPAADDDMAMLALAENIDRENLSDYEIGKALRQVEKLFPSKTKLAESIGMNREDMYRYYAFEMLPKYILERLDTNPRLLSRAAAAEIKRLLQQEEQTPALLESLDSGWQLLEAGKLEQTKLAGYIVRELKKYDGVPLIKPDVRDLRHQGRIVGSVSQDEKALIVKLKAEVLDADQKTRLFRFIDDLLATEV